MYFVVFTDFDLDDLPVVTNVGPFRDFLAAQDYAMANFVDHHQYQVSALVPPAKTTSIHPNQSQISDYIDPVVAN